ncbi:MAG: hypothetical protein OEV49_01070 [candidate division Zixibacteria bacterium]|nr:hypothetical protein [candidate division Zixibacteria bacterium]MDH3937995.1 hypothetical protein [candidate division Zixibacteria bacterium]MDH4034269.1 hypothetical protein [candidate division Zixibacteria bacterium]
MVCAHCTERILDEPIQMAGASYCSESCANLAFDLDPEEGEGYYEESELEGIYEEDE